jgi:hypothetical protein
MNYNHRLDEVSRVLSFGAGMSLAERAKWFAMFATERTDGRTDRIFGAHYEYPGHKPLFDSNLTPEDWQWFDENEERFLESVSPRGRQ